MPKTIKIVFLGASSASFGLNMFRDLCANREFSGSTLVLVGRNKDRLARSAQLAKFLNERSGAGMNIEFTVDRRAALDGASFVVNSAAVDRLRLWKLDFEVPKKYGIRHTLGENAGPGGLFFTLRTIPMIFDFIRDIEELCPKALFINFSNPESRIILALAKYSRIHAIGLCHGVFIARSFAANIMELPPDLVEVSSAGLNHFQCLLRIWHRDTGEDLYPLLREKEKTFDPSFEPLTRLMFRAFGYWLGCGDSHLGEFLPYGYEGGCGEHGYNFSQDERDRAAFDATVNAVLSGSRPSPEDWLKPSGERGAAVIAGVLHNQKRMIESGIVHNQGVIPNLPRDLAVEVPVMADDAGIHPISLGPLPAPVASLMAIQANVQQLAVEAAIHGSKEMALQALLIDPVTNSAAAAVKLLDELWEANRPYIRKCV
jgi:alpha-galactosidase